MSEAENGRTHEPSLRELTAELDGLRELLLAKLEERDRLYSERAQAAKDKVDTAFAASEKAISKAETAQKDYNERSNEFRGALDDATKKQLSRTEADTKFSAQDERIEALRKEVQDLRESRSQSSGRYETRIEGRDSARFTLTQMIAGAGVLLLAVIELHQLGVI